MNKASKLGLIYFICAVLLLLNRILIGLLPLSDNWSGWIYSTASQVFVMFLLPFLLYKLFFKKEDIWLDFRVKPQKKLTPAIWGLILAMAPFFAFTTIGISVIWNGLFLPNIGFTAVSAPGTVFSDGWVLVMELLTGAVMPAFCEEFYNRGLLITAVEDRPDSIGKALFIGIMFGLFHENVAQFAYAIFGGFVFAVLYMKTKSLWPGIVLHFANNAWGTITSYSSQVKNGLGVLYDRVWDFLFDYFFVAIILFVVSFGIVIFLLRCIATASDSCVNKQPTQNNEQSLIGVLFGVDVEAQLQPLKGKPFVSFYHYGYIAATIVVTTLTTIATLIWGILR